MEPIAHKANLGGSKTVTFNGGTGKNGATLKSGPLEDTKADEESFPDEKAAASNGEDSGKVVIQGDVYKSMIVRNHVDNDEALVFEGKNESSEISPSAGDGPIKLGAGGAMFDVTVVRDLRYSMVCNSLKTRGIRFSGD
jgi:hypothetical protein